MQLITCHAGQLQSLSATTLRASSSEAIDTTKAFRTGLQKLDALPPGQAFARGAVHELLMPPTMGRAMFPAMMLARCAAMPRSHSIDNWQLTIGNCQLFSPIICCDPAAALYPPAIAALGISLDQLYLLHPQTLADQTWAIAECLRCTGVGAVVANVNRLSRVEARRLQLAAERGGAVGILMRPAGNASSEYAAATRWLVTPAAGERTVQRWRMQLIHGHGGRVGQAVFLEYRRDDHQTNAVRAIEQLVYRSRTSRTA
jgi:protein ImuA